MKKAKEVRDY